MSRIVIQIINILVIKKPVVFLINQFNVLKHHVDKFMKMIVLLVQMKKLIHIILVIVMNFLKSMIFKNNLVIKLMLKIHLNQIMLNVQNLDQKCVHNKWLILVLLQNFHVILNLVWNNHQMVVQLVKIKLLLDI